LNVIVIDHNGDAEEDLMGIFEEVSNKPSLIFQQSIPYHLVPIKKKPPNLI